MERIDAPFTDEQVTQLNKYQKSGGFHPFTCDRKAKECEVRTEPKDWSKDGVLLATTDGWTCPCGKYKQNWAHQFMADEKVQNTIDNIRGKSPETEV